ncbi:hypothetical protein GGX14DRAFT_407370 [Mycena pura]|uniref:Uncharacterized protein n=1 Tax=Mycena pura TaxID=153505 RepID=A0AAD6USI0_9AGAR|nr:hypothetical protein GGX14DRAFT_407370 [Mycena pura]
MDTLPPVTSTLFVLTSVRMGQFCGTVGGSQGRETPGMSDAFEKDASACATATNRIQYSRAWPVNVSVLQLTHYISGIHLLLFSLTGLTQASPSPPPIVCGSNNLKGPCPSFASCATVTPTPITATMLWQHILLPHTWEQVGLTPASTKVLLTAARGHGRPKFETGNGIVNMRLNTHMYMFFNIAGQFDLSRRLGLKHAHA